MDELERLALNSRNHTHSLYIIASTLEESFKNQIMIFKSLGYTTHAQMIETNLVIIRKLMTQLNQMKIRGD